MTDIHPTAEQIADACDVLEGQANITAINKLFREMDESDLWPICGKFNVTERAIRKAAIQRDSGAVYGLEYACLLESIISQEVNDETNW